jgi:hypothetical protein
MHTVRHSQYNADRLGKHTGGHGIHQGRPLVRPGSCHHGPSGCHKHGSWLDSSASQCGPGRD